jgi:hypothetical protein
MIITRLTGGLGNQMFQFSAGLAVATRHGVALQLDFAPGAVFTPRSYSLDIFDIQVEKWPVLKKQLWIGRALPWRLLRWMLKLPKLTILHETGHGFHENVGVVAPPTYLDGYWQSYKYFMDISEDLYRRFRPSRTIPAEINRWKTTIQKHNAIGIHIRRGDYLTDPDAKELLGALDANYYQRGARHFTQCLADAHCYVFSDDREWARNELKLPVPFTVVDHEQEHPFWDMWLMSQCNALVIANSSFSWWAAWLSRLPGERIVAPQRWLNSPSMDNQDLVPPTWTRM